MMSEARESAASAFILGADQMSYSKQEEKLRNCFPKRELAEPESLS